MKRAIIASLRIVSMTSKLFLMMLLAKYFSVKDVGEYGLILALVNILVLIIGLDFYTFSQSELSKGGSFENVLSNQLILHAIMYVFAFLWIYTNGSGDYSITTIFIFLLLVSEHLNQEISRYLIYFEEQMIASILLFTRSGLWVLCYVIYILIVDDYNLHDLFVFWLSASVCTLMLSIYLLNHQVKISFKLSSVNFEYLGSGLRKSILILCAGVSFKSLFFLDRYILGSYSSLEIVGVYIFYITLMVSALSFLEPLVISFSYPKLLKSFNALDYYSYNQVLKKSALHTFFFIVTTVLGFYIFTQPLLHLLGKEEYLSYLWILSFLYPIIVLYCMAIFIHYLLYSIDLNRFIFYSHASSVLVFVFFIFMLKHLLPFNMIENILYSLIVAYTWMVMSSAYLYFNNKRF
ncbi:hypothetical protein [Vibrio sp. AH4]|uniref:hypothetical protein n=1 Tax=Vibrio sp. AH4 TaxID=2919577 RepID=UPI0027396CF6|nr:hypothetical protein [Vibrio sp. AH4]MDP4491808.1 hypothetical protein [Vibrio sp. AH4]